MAECWFARRMSNIGPCDGPMDRAHILPKRHLKWELRHLEGEALEQVIWHPAIWVWGCRRHHGNFDGKHLRVQRHQLPLVAERYVEVFELHALMEREYGPHPGLGVTTSDHDEAGTW